MVKGVSVVSVVLLFVIVWVFLLFHLPSSVLNVLPLWFRIGWVLNLGLTAFFFLLVGLPFLELFELALNQLHRLLSFKCCTVKDINRMVLDGHAVRAYECFFIIKAGISLSWVFLGWSCIGHSWCQIEGDLSYGRWHLWMNRKGVKIPQIATAMILVVVIADLEVKLATSDGLLYLVCFQLVISLQPLEVLFL